MKLSFFVPGIPAPGGSKRFVGFGKKSGRAILVDDAGERNKNWRSIVAVCGRDAMSKGIIENKVPVWFHGPLRVRFDFIMPRRKGDFSSKGGVKASAPFYHTTRPDALKLARSTEDALTGIVWNDDAQTAMLEISKRYADKGEPCGCQITIQAL
jgi:Holliday junction resolvase RusA-like endonuclease